MAKRVPPLNAAKLTKFKPDPVKVLELVDGAVPGLGFALRSWHTSFAGIRFMEECVGLMLVTWPSDARIEAEDPRRRIKAGADPTAEKRASRQQTRLASQGIGTFRAVLDTYFTNGPGPDFLQKVIKYGVYGLSLQITLNGSIRGQVIRLQLSVDNHGQRRLHAQ